jgi:hypothetical protein
MLSKPQTYDHIAGLIRRLAKPGLNLTLTDHARQRMLERDIQYADVLPVLKSCRVVHEILNDGEWVYNAKGKNVDGEEIVFAVVPYESQNRIKIISTWKDGL